MLKHRYNYPSRWICLKLCNVHFLLMKLCLATQTNVITPFQDQHGTVSQATLYQWNWATRPTTTSNTKVRKTSARSSVSTARSTDTTPKTASKRIIISERSKSLIKWKFPSLDDRQKHQMTRVVAAPLIQKTDRALTSSVIDVSQRSLHHTSWPTSSGRRLDTDGTARRL